jgi:hypothetical protein
MSSEFTTWLLGIGGYAGLFGSLAVVYMYPTFPRHLLPALFVMPVASAGGLYVFFRVLYMILGFAVLVLQAMLNEQLTVILIAMTFIGGQAVLIGFVVYKNATANAIFMNNAAEDEELQPEEYEEEEGEDEDEDEDEEEEADEEADEGEDADTEEGAPVPAAQPTCENCDDNCFKCMPPLLFNPPMVTGLSENSTCDINGVCLMDGGAAIKNMLDELDEAVKID